MNRKKILIFALILASISAAPAKLTKAEESKPAIAYKSTLAAVPSEGITTNKLDPYVLNEKEIQGVLGNFSEEIERLKLNAGYYVFDNEKYDLKDSEVYVMISLGKRNTTGYGLKILSAEDIEGISKIKIQETKPSPDQAVGDAITYPYVILRFDQGTSNVKVVTDTEKELSSLVSPSELSEAGWNDLKPWWEVPSDKEWLITFKKDIDTDAIDDNTIYVRDSAGNKVSVNLTSGKENNSIKVTPWEKYMESETYYLFISDNVFLKKDSANATKGYRMSFSIESAVSVGDPVNQEANSCVISARNENAPIFDASTGLQAGTLSKGFSIDLSDIRDEKVYFSIPAADGNSAQKKYYVPIKYLSKAYKEPFAVPMIISTDKIKIKEGASLYTVEDGVKQSIMTASQPIGPMHYIMKTSNGYEFVFANNLVYVDPKDAEVIKE